MMKNRDNDIRNKDNETFSVKDKESVRRRKELNAMHKKNNRKKNDYDDYYEF